MAEDTWTLILQLNGATPENEYVQKEMDKDILCFFNLVGLVEDHGFTAMDYMYYKRREGSGTATLVGIQSDNDVTRMLAEFESEKKVRLCVMKEKAGVDSRVSITPLKVSGEMPRSESNKSKEAPAIFREDTIKEYRNSQARAEILNILRNRREQEMAAGQCSLMNGSSNQPSDSPGTLETDNMTPTDWPSHARRCRTELEGRCTLKGHKVAKKRFNSGSQKLPIQFSTRLGAPIGINYRSFVEEVVMFTKMKAPLIGVRKWKYIHDTVKKSIAVDVLAKWDLADTRITGKKIWDIARERYRGWRSNLHATYQAYKTDGLRFKNKPEDLNILEWEYLIHYFATDKKFQRDEETGEEPNMLDLWKATHMKNNEWSNTAVKDVYENACSKISEREAKTGNPVPTEDQNIVFQAIYRASTGCKTSQGRGQGYMAKAQTTAEMLHAQLDEQTHITAETQQQNADLSCEVKDLEARLAAQKEESDRRLQAEHNERLRFEEEQRNAQLKMQEEERREREIFRKEMMEMLRGQITASAELSEPSVQIPSENAELHGPTKNNRCIKILLLCTHFFAVLFLNELIRTKRSESKPFNPITIKLE